MGKLWTILTHLHSLAGPGVMLLYPLYASVQAMETPSKLDDEQWLAYWILYSFITLMEMVLESLIYWIPIWYELKLLFLAWLALPNFRGAAFIYDRFVREQLRKHGLTNHPGSGTGTGGKKENGKDKSPSPSPKEKENAKSRYESVQAMESPSKLDDEQWLAYWILYSFITLLEMILKPLIYWIPIWYELKLLFMAWLVLPNFRGAAFIYDKLVRERVKKHGLMATESGNISNQDKSPPSSKEKKTTRKFMSFLARKG